MQLPKVVFFFVFTLIICECQLNARIQPTHDDDNLILFNKDRKDLQKAINALKPGDTLLIPKGHYHLETSLLIQIKGSAIKPVVIRGHSGNATVFDGTGFTKDKETGEFPSRRGLGLIHVEGAQHVILKNIKVINSRNIGIQVRDSKNIIITHCRTDRTFGSGIALWYSDSCEVKHCEITRANDKAFHSPDQPEPREAPHEGLTVAGAVHFNVHDNTVHNGFKEGIDVKEVSAYGVVHNNYIYDMPRQGLYVDSWFGLLHDVEFHSNIVHDCEWGMAISAEGEGSEMKNISIHHNVFYNNRGSGILFGVWGHDRPRDNLRVYNNTIYNCGSQDHWAGITGGIDIRSANIKNTEIFNNISYANYGFDIASYAEPDKAKRVFKEKNIEITHNLIGITTFIPQTEGFFSPVYGIKGESAIVADPMFVDVSEHDFRIMPQSPANSSGKPLYHDYNPDIHRGALPVIRYKAVAGTPWVPVLSGEPWKICNMPDLGELNGPDPSKQHIVDHGFVQDDYGTWHLWACMRGTAVGRLLYAWEGASLHDIPWKARGIAARALPEWNERIKKNGEESIQAPHFMKTDTGYYCFYNSNGARLMFSKDGTDFQRIKFKNNNNILYDKVGRDMMVLKEGNTYFSYSTVTTVTGDDWLRGMVILRESKDLKRWSDYSIVSAGGQAANGAVSAESPFVVKLDGYYYLFRSSSMTFNAYVYRSKNPYGFGVNTDEKLIAILPIKAPEIIRHNDEWYISDLADFTGIRMYRLRWEKE